MISFIFHSLGPSWSTTSSDTFATANLPCPQLDTATPTPRLPDPTIFPQDSPTDDLFPLRIIHQARHEERSGQGHNATPQRQCLRDILTAQSFPLQTENGARGEVMIGEADVGEEPSCRDD